MNDLRAGIALRIIRAQAHKAGRCGREAEQLLSTFALPGAAEALPGLAIKGGMELVLGRRPPPPVDFQSAERGDSAEVDLQPRLFHFIRRPRRCVSIIDRQLGIAAAGGRLPQFFRWDCHGYLQFSMAGFWFRPSFKP